MGGQRRGERGRGRPAGGTRRPEDAQNPRGSIDRSLVIVTIPKRALFAAMRSLTFLASRLAPLHDRGDRWTKLASSLFQRGGLLASRFSHPKVWKSLIFPARENSSFFGKPYAAVLLETDLTTRVFYLSGIWSRAGERKKGYSPLSRRLFFRNEKLIFWGMLQRSPPKQLSLWRCTDVAGTQQHTAYRGKTRGKRWRERTHAHLKERERE